MSTRLPLTEGLKSLHYYFAILDDLVFSTDLIEIDARSFFAEGDRIIISIDNSCKYILPDQIIHLYGIVTRHSIEMKTTRRWIGIDDNPVCGVIHRGNTCRK